MKTFSTYKPFLFLVVGLLVINVLASFYFQRIDLTQDKRYTLSQAAKNIVSQVNAPLIIDVFLDGDFPSEFRRLQQETRYMLEELSAYNSNIIFNFINPLEEDVEANAIAEEFYNMGMIPARLNVVENGKASETIIFPWALANYNNETVKIPLLKNVMGASDEDRVTNSVQQLEYVFIDGIAKLTQSREKKIAVMRGNGQLPDRNISDFIKTIQQYYLVAPFTLDSVAVNAQKTLDQLNEYDLIIEAKPTQPYTEEEKLVLDQYLMQGGKALWLAEKVAMETDSLFNAAGTAFALPRDLNLNDLFFSYGIRINPVLINDIYSAPIVLASGSGSDTQFVPYPWFYSPLSTSPNTHSIINNIEAVKFDWAGQIDTLQNSIKKTVLLTSSPRSKLEGVPREIDLSIINTRPEIETYVNGEHTLAVLLEGEFKSAYKNRVKPVALQESIDDGVDTKMIVIADGDVIKNEIQRGEPMELGFDRYTGATYGNKEFLLNAINYLLDDSGLIDVRSKEITLAFLNIEKASEERTKWQVINLIIPVLLLLVFAFLFNFFRRKRFTKNALN